VENRIAALRAQENETMPDESAAVDEKIVTFRAQESEKQLEESNVDERMLGISGVFLVFCLIV
jgi:hypothetical protein